MSTTFRESTFESSLDKKKIWGSGDLKSRVNKLLLSKRVPSLTTLSLRVSFSLFVVNASQSINK